MSAIYLLSLVGLLVAGYVFGRARGRHFKSGSAQVHSLPTYHGWFVAVSAALPMLLLFVLWSALAPKLIEAQTLASLPAAMQPADDLARASVLREIHNAAAGGVLAEQASPEIRDAAAALKSLETQSNWALLGLGLGLAGLGFLLSYTRLSPDFRARNRVERVVR